jgi:phosphatidylethanolamine-binding protein (PEBP) family uncharacterized protein
MTPRFGLIALALSVFAGQASAFEISSPSVSDGKWDNRYIGDSAGGCTGGSVSIALNWKDPPAGTKSYALTMFDPDAGGGKGLPKGAVLGKGDIGRAGYFGPCPPPGSGAHHYVFTLYALKAAKLNAKASASPATVAAAAKAQSLGTATVTYTYGR